MLRNVLFGLAGAAIMYFAIKWFGWYVVLSGLETVAILFVIGVTVAIAIEITEWLQEFLRLLRWKAEVLWHRATRRGRGQTTAPPRRPAAPKAERSTTRKVVVVAAVTAVSIAVPTTLISLYPPLYHRLVLAVAPALIAWKNPDPSYAALISPRYAAPAARPDVLVVKQGVPTTMRFGISPQLLTDSLVTLTPNARILKSADEVRLTVTMTCEVCESHRTFIDRLVYRPDLRATNLIEFKFVPTYKEPASGTGRLILSVVSDKGGHEMDRLTIPVLVTRDGAPAQVDSQVALQRHGVPKLAPSSDLSTDVVLWVYQDQDQRVRLQLLPISARGHAALARHVLDRSEQPKAFSTRLRDQRDLDRITTSSYDRISRILAPRDNLRRTSDGVVSDDSKQTSKLTVDEAARLSEAIASTGRELYADLFLSSPDPSLGAAIRELEKDELRGPNGRPLKVQVYTDLRVPWQYLIPVGAATDVRQFWGMRFELEVQRTDINRPRWPDAPDSSQPPQVLFAKFAVDADESVKFADLQIAQLGGAPPVAIVTSADQLRSRLIDDRAKISAIFLFLHSASVLAAEESYSSTAPPRLYFAKKEWVEGPELADLRFKRPAEEVESGKPYLAGWPLVILNACETGPAAVALPHKTLEVVMLELGARGVVATEVPVLTPLAHLVSSKLIDKLSRGEPAAAALTSIRNELYANFNNPLGLLYAYYGEPAATLRR